VVSAYRIVAFQRLLKKSTPADKAVTAQARELGRSMGLKRLPLIVMLHQQPGQNLHDTQQKAPRSIIFPRHQTIASTNRRGSRNTQARMDGRLLNSTIRHVAHDVLR
jgi:hypothetical protein